MHKRQRVEASQTLDRQKFEMVIPNDDKDDNDGDEDMAGPSLDLFFPQPEEDLAEREKSATTKETTKLGEAEKQAADATATGGQEVAKPKHTLPISHQVILESHEKSVQSLCINREGTKMVSGGLDYRMKIWDFTTMNRNLKPFKDFKPFDGHPVRTLSFNPSGSHFLCCCGNN